MSMYQPESTSGTTEVEQSLLQKQHPHKVRGQDICSERLEHINTILNLYVNVNVPYSVYYKPMMYYKPTRSSALSSV